MNNKNSVNGHNLFDAISQLFGKPSPSNQVENSSPSLPEMESAFNTALQQLNGKIEELQRQQQLQPRGSRELSAITQAEERERRMQHAHALIFNDIVKMHRKLATGIDPPALESLAKFLGECVEKVVVGPSLQEMMPCCRRGVLRRFHLESGGAAWAELEERLSAGGEAWPAMTQRDPFEGDADFIHRQQLKYRERCNDFLNYDIARSSELIRGIERAWQSDYPEPGTRLWRELVLEGVATALRARILQRYYDRLLKNKDKIVGRAAELVGRELGNLQQVLARKSLNSLEDAHRIATTSSRVLDEVIPEIAWQVVRAEEAGEVGEEL